jgi:hypothetical protein
MTTPNPFTAEERQQLLQESFEVIEWLDNFTTRYTQLRLEPGFIQLLEQERTQQERLVDLRKQYSDRVPIIPLCRCPYSPSFSNGCCWRIVLSKFGWGQGRKPRNSGFGMKLTL